ERAHAVVGKALPHLGREQECQGARVAEDVRLGRHACCVVCHVLSHAPAARQVNALWLDDTGKHGGCDGPGRCPAIVCRGVAAGGKVMTKRYQVVIVGGGPVGVALAVDLGLRGVSCALVERRTRLQQIPKGQNLTQRTLEHFYFWGIVEELRAARVMPPTYPIGNVTTYKTLLSPYWHARPGREQVRRYYFQDNERLPQYCTEAVLL